MHLNQRFTQVRLVGLLLAFVLLLSLWPATPVIRADSPTDPAQARHYRADETPPGLIAGEWQQITAQLAQQAYLKASNTGGDDHFGWTVALDGDTLVVGAPDEDSNATNGQIDNSASDAGAVYIFTRSSSTWSQQAYLKASNTGAGDFFGASVALDGDTLVVGADGEDSNATGVNGNQNDDTATDAGAAYVFTRSGSTWSQQAYLKASNTDGADNFGYSVALDGNTVVVGAKSEDSNDVGAGAAYVFTRSGSTWSQQAYLKASNTGMLDNFGNSVALDGNTLVIGANGEASNAIGVNGDQNDDSAQFAGAAYVFTRPVGGSTWSQQAYLKASNTGGIDFFGYSVDLSGDTVVVGAYREDSNATGVNGNQTNISAGDAGAAYIFTRSGSTWSQQAYLKASNTNAGDSFGISVALDSNTLMVGANGEDSSANGVGGNQADNFADAAGAAYVFTRSGSTWSQQAYLKASNPGENNEFGISVALSGDTVVVGAYRENSNATGVGGNGDNDLAPDAGAAYTFTDQASSTSTIYLPLLAKN